MFYFSITGITCVFSPSDSLKTRHIVLYTSKDPWRSLSNDPEYFSPTACLHQPRYTKKTSFLSLNGSFVGRDIITSVSQLFGDPTRTFELFLRFRAKLCKCLDGIISNVFWIHSVSSKIQVL